MNGYRANRLLQVACNLHLFLPRGVAAFVPTEQRTRVWPSTGGAHATTVQLSRFTVYATQRVVLILTW